MPSAYTSLIPPDIAWFRSEAEWILRVGTAPVVTNPDGPRRLWRSNSFVQRSWWAPLTQQAISYKFIARDPVSKKVLLTPIESREAYNTYSASALAAYRSCAFIVPNGVPYLVERTFSSDEVREVNFSGSTVVVDYPVELPTDRLLVPLDGDLEVMTIPEFLALATPPPMSAAEKVQAILQILDTSMSAENKLLAVGRLLERR